MIPFSKYFENWLYSKDGYYANYKTIGKNGDFFTAVSTSSFFGGAIAKRIIETIKSGFVKKNTTIIEIGSHHGYLLADIIQFIYTLEPQLLKTLTFGIIEKFEPLRAQQETYLNNSFGKQIVFKHYKSFDEIDSKSAIIVANEIFDAFPCELVYKKNDILLQSFIDNNDCISFLPCKNKFLEKQMQKFKINKGEIPLGYTQFANEMATSIETFEFITFDYGEIYPRNDFSCRIYKNHNVYPILQGYQDDKSTNNQNHTKETSLNLKKLYKKTDITYDVNFNILFTSFMENGINNVFYKTQLKALIEFGIIELLEILKKNVDNSTYLRELNKIKTLLEPTGMGDRYKCAIFRKG